MTLANLKQALWRRHHQLPSSAKEGTVYDVYFFPDGLLGRWAERCVLIDSEQAFAQWLALDDETAGLPIVWEYRRFEAGSPRRDIASTCAFPRVDDDPPPASDSCCSTSSSTVSRDAASCECGGAAARSYSDGDVCRVD